MMVLRIAVILSPGFLSAKDTFERLSVRRNEDGSISIDPYFETTGKASSQSVMFTATSNSLLWHGPREFRRQSMHSKKSRARTGSTKSVFVTTKLS
jgi:hypothetical protein